jgi:transposase
MLPCILSIIRPRCCKWILRATSFLLDVSTGELIGCPVFVAVLPFSGYGYVEALPNAKLVHVVKALNNALDYFGGYPWPSSLTI